MIILGIDPGSRITGFGIVKKTKNKTEHIENGTLYLEKKGSFANRLVYLHQELQAIIAAFGPTELSIENIFYHKNPKSVQKLGEVRGVCQLSGAIAGLNIFEYTPLEVKKAITGHGKASKEQVQYMICKLLGLKDRAEENASDALGIALCHAHNQSPITQANNAISTTQNRAKELLKNASFYR